MVVEYKWNFNSIKVKSIEGNLKDIVVSYEWRRGLVDGEYYVDCYGSLSLENPDSDNFKDFENLSQDDFIEWTTNALTQEAIDNYDVSLATQMENIKNPPIQNKIAPWLRPAPK